jgi:transcriptional regulator of met regulon
VADLETETDKDLISLPLNATKSMNSDIFNMNVQTRRQIKSYHIETNGKMLLMAYLDAKKASKEEL